MFIVYMNNQFEKLMKRAVFLSDVNVDLVSLFHKLDKLEINR